MPDRTVDQILEANLDGEPPTHAELRVLCDLAVEGEKHRQELEALRNAVANAGYTIVDFTTEEDDELVFVLDPNPPEDELLTKAP